MNMRFLYHALYRIVWPFFSLAHPVGARGRENIPEGGAVLCANHSALCDPILVCFACTLRWMVRPMAKIELSRVPALGWLLGKAGVIYVDRGHADVHAVKEALKWLKEGQKLLVFPEGTRVRKGEDVKGKSGAALFATRTGPRWSRSMSPGRSTGSGPARWSLASPSIRKSPGGRPRRRSWSRSQNT